MIQIGSPDREMEPRYLRAPGGFAWWYVDLITPEGDGLVLIWSYGLPFLPGYARNARRGRPQLPLDRPSVNVVAYERGRPSFYLLQEYGTAGNGGQETGDREQGTGDEGAGESVTAAQLSTGDSRPSSFLGASAVAHPALRTPHAATSGGRPPFPARPRNGPATAGTAGRGSAEGGGIAGSGGDVRRIGNCSFISRVEQGRRMVDVELDCPVPGTSARLTGRVRVDGVARRGTEAIPSDPDPPHLWTPLTGPATGSAALDFGGRSLLRLRGRAYHDRNGGCVPLDDLGIDRWMWGRFPLAGRELIVYLLWPVGVRGEPRLIGLTIHEDGATRAVGELSAEIGRTRRGFAGIPWPEKLRLLRGTEQWAEIRPVAVVDNGPFYLRFQAEVVTADGERALGWSELCHPARVDLAWHRPLVRMRVHHTAAANSFWLPLFAGPRADRVGRLARQLWPGAR